VESLGIPCHAGDADERLTRAGLDLAGDHRKSWKCGEMGRGGYQEHIGSKTSLAGSTLASQQAWQNRMITPCLRTPRRN
jgi:hypothetical protein